MILIFFMLNIKDLLSSVQGQPNWSAFELTNENGQCKYPYVTFDRENQNWTFSKRLLFSMENVVKK